MSLQEPGNREFTAFLFAARAGRIEALRALLKHGANVNDTLPIPPARQEAEGTSPRKVRVMGQYGPPVPGCKAPDCYVPNTWGTSALMLAVMNQKYEAAAFLLDNGADPNLALNGWTPLHQMTWNRRPTIGLNTVMPVV